MSYDEKTKTYEYKPVAQTFTAVKENIVKIKIRGEKLLITTTEHPFYVKKTYRARDSLPNDDDEEGEWLTASELKVGDKVLRPDGKWTRITSIEYSTEPTIVYNLEVEGNHNYFVGEIGVLSHNCNWVGKAVLGLRNPTAKGFDRYVDVIGPTFTEAGFMKFAGNAKEILFDLKGFSPDEFQRFLKEGDFNATTAGQWGDATNWELWKILSTPELFKKTQFKNVPQGLDLSPR